MRVGSSDGVRLVLHHDLTVEQVIDPLHAGEDLADLVPLAHDLAGRLEHVLQQQDEQHERADRDRAAIDEPHPNHTTAQMAKASISATTKLNCAWMFAAPKEARMLFSV